MPKIKPIIVKVRISKLGQKYLTVPKDSPIKAGDYVFIEKLVGDQDGRTD